jgi:3-hydroxybutyryl-CoA dehydratase
MVWRCLFRVREKRKTRRLIEEMNVGEKLTLTEKMEDKALLLYLGLTNDANPLYIQHDYASQPLLKKTIIPTVMLVSTFPLSLHS